MGEIRERLGPLAHPVRTRIEKLAREHVADRIWNKDATVWKDDDAHAKVIANRLGWLGSLEPMREAIRELTQFADEAREEGFKQVVLLGMGGSSLAPEVLQKTFGPAKAYLDLRVCDSTDPDAVKAVEAWANLPKTLFIVASKSGTTVETLAFYDYFVGRGAKPAQFVAITDPNSPLEAAAKTAGFRQTFLNPADIGGRYSALSYFGMVPAALLGVDLEPLLDSALTTSTACASTIPEEKNPGVRLGALLGEGVLAARDKLTFIVSPPLASFGSWVEQLIAESTGKEGRGILPIDGEALASADAYGDDRMFAYIRDQENPDADQDALIDALEKAGTPIYTLELAGPEDLGGLFFLWEFATAIAGAVMGINPFDEPNVRESKQLTGELLERFESEGGLPEEGLLVTSDDLRLYADDELRPPVDATLEDIARVHFDRVKPKDFIGLLAYVNPTEAVSQTLHEIRAFLRQQYGVATAFGIGPRFLHSTGQFFKGGPDNGLFLQIIHDNPNDVEIPGKGYGFGILKQAQALGDFKALVNHGRRVLRCQIDGDLVSGLVTLRRVLETIG